MQTSFESPAKLASIKNQLNIGGIDLITIKIINKDKKIHLLKTHNAMCEINGNKFTDSSNTISVLYIVRDPRNLITSLSHHYKMTLDQSFEFMTNKRKIIFKIQITFIKIIYFITHNI